MDLLVHWEHWRCDECGTFDGPHDEGYCTVCHERGIDDAVVEQYVAAAQLRGAVEALQVIADDRVPGMRRVPTVVQAYVQGVLARIGGQ
jgi:hypothetical protein